MIPVSRPASQLPLAQRIVPHMFARSRAKANDQVLTLIAIADRAGLHLARDFLKEVWEAAETVDTVD